MTKKIDVDEEADNTLNEIEGNWGPERCDLSTYRDFLKSLGMSIQHRVEQLNAEIGNG